MNSHLLTSQQRSDLEIHRKYYQSHDHLLSDQSVSALKQMLDIIQQKNIIGDIVQCGVWKGGSLLLLSKYMQQKKLQRNIWGYDTFAGFTTQATMEKDSIIKPYLDYIYDSYPTLDIVSTSLISKGASNVTLVKHDMSQPVIMLPRAISLLHIDVDLFEPTFGALT